MIAWLTDTLLYTGALIVLVLVLRRPAARHFGPQIGYALWALPLLRFVMPPIVLPASFAPQTSTETTISSTTVTSTVDGVPVTPPPAPAEIFYNPGPTFWESWGGLIVSAALVVWLAGALTFLAWRAWTYFRMREWLLDGARPVGEAGDVRLVESPAVSSPVAFGVSDKVVALPIGFMASENRFARDLAIEHELAHHRGHDLLANILAQPILALHWFNPLAWMGWRAMRRDQEAACDARVIAARGPWERAAYGQVIASFAAGQRLALAAPMACPVLGEKSIIHRLRSLSMDDISPRRRFAGRALLAGAALALPFTASISYAEASIASPAAPESPTVRPAAITVVDVPEGTDPNAKLHTRVFHKDGQTVILKTARPVTEEQAQASVARAQASLARAQALAGPTAAERVAAARIRHSMTDEQWTKFNAQWAKASQAWGAKQAQDAEAFGASMAKWGEEYGKQWEAWGEKIGKGIAAPAPTAPVAPPVAVKVQVPAYSYGFYYSCDERGNLVKIQATPGNTRTGPHMSRCQKVADANANARRALLQARARIEDDRQMNSDVRDQVIDSLDQEIDRLDSEEANS